MARLLHFHVSLMDVDSPRVWREIVIPSIMTFDDLHYAIQYSMGWEDAHLYQFQDRKHMYDDLKTCINVPMEGDDEFGYEVTDARKMKLNSYFKRVGTGLYYVYDFGDDWVHEITLERISNGYPRVYCTGGEGACPPEDVGGTSMYKEMKRLFEEEPDDDQTITFRTWLGLEDDEDWDEYEFSKRAAQRCLDLWLRLTRPKLLG